jgi:hypothetical protein
MSTTIAGLPQEILLRIYAFVDLPDLRRRLAPTTSAGPSGIDSISRIPVAPIPWRDGQLLRPSMFVHTSSGTIFQKSDLRLHQGPSKEVIDVTFDIRQFVRAVPASDVSLINANPVGETGAFGVVLISLCQPKSVLIDVQTILSAFLEFQTVTLRAWSNPRLVNCRINSNWNSR